MKTDWPELTAACLEGMKAAKEKPGLYGGRYVARTDKEEDGFRVLDDDDPDLYRNDETLDIMAQATPDKVYAIGRVGNYLREDGSVKFQK